MLCELVELVEVLRGSNLRPGPINDRRSCSSDDSSSLLESPCISYGVALSAAVPDGVLSGNSSWARLDVSISVDEALPGMSQNTESDRTMVPTETGVSTVWG